MTRKRKLLILSILLLLTFLIHFYSNDSLSVENNYADGVYKPISICLRFFTGWLPFSIGDILYGIAFIWLCWILVSVIIKLFKRKITISHLRNGLYKFIVVLFSVYIVFNVLWGINYNREGIAFQLGLDTKKYTAAELRNVDSLLLQKVNSSKKSLINRKNSGIKSNKELFNESEAAYKNISNEYSFLIYKGKSIKSSLWGWLGDYVGFSGYYNPFTGEAQVNTTVPYFLQPYTTCHEMAHQLGYAKEDEANFVGYLAAAASTDTLFHYSVYLDLFLSANRNLFMVDSVIAKSFAKQLIPPIKTDLKEWRAFIESHQTPVEPLIRWMYGEYLENNKQPFGLLTYDEVTGLLIDYYKKYGKI